MPACPDCGSPMVSRRNRSTGEPFLGCTRFPACRGTLPPTKSDASTRPTRPKSYRLSLGGRPRSLPDYVELIVARRLGRNLTPLQGCVVQVLAVVVIGFAAWALFASGTITRIIEPFAQWYAQQVFSVPTPSSTPIR